MSEVKNILVIYDITLIDNFKELVKLSYDTRYGTTDTENGFVVILYFKCHSREILRYLFPDRNWHLYTIEDCVDNHIIFEIEGLLKVEFFKFEEPNEIKINLFPNGLDAVAKRIKECLLS